MPILASLSSHASAHPARIGMWPSDSDIPVEAPPPGLARSACGEAALYNLLRIEGHDVPYFKIALRLPSGDARGHSMAQLRDAARDLGIELVGVRISRFESPPTNPLLMLQRRSGHGHYVVVRRVGHSGKLLQVIDSSSPPTILDAVDFGASADWTGMALAERRPRRPPLGLVIGAVGALLILGSISIFVRSIRSKPDRLLLRSGDEHDPA
jgi:hypothetical protein